MSSGVGESSGMPYSVLDPMDREEEFTLFTAFQKNNEQIKKLGELPELLRRKEAMLDKIVRCNTRFVISVAKKLSVNGVVERDDLVAEGLIALMEAAERFDPERGVKFISYAVFQIRNRMLMALIEASVVRVPHERFMKANAIDNERKRKEHEELRSISLVQTLEEKGHNPDDILYYFYIAERCVSLDNLMESGEHQGKDISQMQIEEYGVSSVVPEDALTEYSHARLKEDILHEIRSMGEREAYILLNYFGFDCTPTNLVDISKDLGMSRERVRQEKDTALRKLSRKRRVRNHRGGY